ncbi:MAG: HXXEE domain-containing protein [bacterium]
MVQFFFSKSRLGPYRHGMAWFALCIMFGVHAVDEVLTDFLSFYNPLVLALQEKIALLPLPIFTFQAWVVSSIIEIVVLLLLSPLVFKGVRFMKSLSYIFGAMIFFNGLLHITGSIVLGRFLPGVFSSPLLLLFALHLLVATHKREQWQGEK